MIVESQDSSFYKMLNSPFKWVGGKSRIRKAIIPMLPQHTCYVEPFAGAAWVLFGKPPSDVEVLNDIDQELINFFRVVREQPQDLIASFEWELVSRSEFERLANLDVSELSDVQRAHRFYYLIMAGWGGEARYPPFSDQRLGWRTRQPLGRRPENPGTTVIADPPETPDGDN